MFATEASVERIVAQTKQGSMGILPHRLDCAAELVPGILSYQSAGASMTYVAIDQGVLVKAGMDVMVSAHNAFQGTDLDKLHEAMTKEFLAGNELEKSVRSVLTKMEGGFIRRFMEFQHG